MSFEIDWFDLFAVQGTLKSLLQHHSSKASILRCSAFFMVQLSHPYMTTGKTIALTRRTLAKWYLCFLIRNVGFYSFSSMQQASLNFVVAVTFCSDFGAQENKICHCFHFFPLFVCHKVMGPDAMIVVFWMLSLRPSFSLSSFTLLKRLFSSSLLPVIRVVCHLHIWGCWYFSQQSGFQLVFHVAFLARHQKIKKFP